MTGRGNGIFRLAAVIGVVVAAGSCGPQAQPAAARIATIKKVVNNLYVINGGGTNTIALIAATGVVLVDTNYSEWIQPVLAALRTVTDKPVTTIINTHAHADHTLGDRSFPPSVTIIAHENTRKNMAATMAEFQGENEKFLPRTTFKDQMTLLTGNDRIELNHFGPGHTDGDAVVVFPALRVAATGDLFPAMTPPIIVRLQGGSGVAYPTTLSRMLRRLDGVDTFITGHSDRVFKRADLQQFTDFNREVLDWTESQHAAGTNAKLAAFAWQMPPRYEHFTEPWRVTTTVQLIYEELNHEPPHRLRPWWKFW